jgi:2-haloacid dehalogenase
MNFAQFKLISFDCYGTLVDWKRSLQDILNPFITRHKLDITADKLYELFLIADQKNITCEYKPYSEVLVSIMDEIGKELKIDLKHAERTCLVDRFGDWTAFTDSSDALQELKKSYKLAVISNVDDELFNVTKRCLGVRFDYIITAKQVGSYKPSKNNFIRALEIFGLPKEQVLHVSQSIYHDIIPTNELGWSNVWINRYNEPRSTDPAEMADVEVPDLASLVGKIRESEEVNSEE